MINMDYTDLKTTIAEGKIANALKSTAADHVVAKAENIYDTSLKGYQSEINDNFTNKFNNYLLLTGGTLTGDLTIKKNSSDSPSIILQRAETNDTYEDWRMSNVGGYFKIQNRNSGNTWVDVLSLAPSATKTLTSSYSVLPSANNTLTLGDSTHKWKDVYATNFLGKATTASYLDGNAATSVNDCHGDKILKYYTLPGSLVIGSDNQYAGLEDSYGFPVSGNANGLLWLGNYSGNYGHQLGFSSDGRIYHRSIVNGSFPTTANGGSWKKLAFTTDIPASYTHPTSGVNPGDYGPSTNVTPSYGDSFNVPHITINEQGHITSASNKSITIPDIPIATDSVLGGIKLGYTQSDKKYPVELDSNNKAYVSVPWTDTNTDTDTKNTTGSTNSTSKMYLIGAPSQGANPQTYSNSNVYTENGDLVANSFQGSIKGVSVLDVNAAYKDLHFKFYNNITGCDSTVSTDGKRYAGTANSFGFPVSNNANSMLWLGAHTGNYGHQLGFSSDGRIYDRYISNGSFQTNINGGSWKKIAFTSDIPTKTSELTNDSGYLTSIETATIAEISALFN